MGGSMREMVHSVLGRGVWPEAGPDRGITAWSRSVAGLVLYLFNKADGMSRMTDEG